MYCRHRHLLSTSLWGSNTTDKVFEKLRHHENFNGMKCIIIEFPWNQWLLSWQLDSSSRLDRYFYLSNSYNWKSCEFAIITGSERVPLPGEEDFYAKHGEVLKIYLCNYCLWRCCAPPECVSWSPVFSTSWLCLPGSSVFIILMTPLSRCVQCSG